MSAVVIGEPAGSGSIRRRASESMVVLQRIGRSLMLPIAVLPAAGLLLRLGQDDLLGKNGLGWDQGAQVIGGAGQILFDNLPLLFAMGVAAGFARKSDGSTAISAAVGWLVFDRVFRTLTADNIIAGAPVTMGVLSGILMGIVTAKLYERFYRSQPPPYLAFFGGRRSVPIVTALAAVLLG